MLIFKNKFFKVLLITLVGLALVWAWVLIDKNQKYLEVDFYDVGQGDAIFIETPNKKQVLIDGGADLTILEKLGQELPFWDRHIDLIILTHPEHDHIGGLIEVIKRYKVGKILTTGAIRDTAQYKEWKKIIQQENIPVYIAQAGQIIKLEDHIKLVILHPFNKLDGVKIKRTNNASIVSKLVFNEFEVLLTGDIEKEIERELVNSGINLQSDILKVPHHGSKTSSTKNFIAAVNPQLAIIQAGKNNSYGHPHKSVLENLNNIPTFITGQDGDIEILSNGIRFQIKHH